MADCEPPTGCVASVAEVVTAPWTRSEAGQVLAAGHDSVHAPVVEKYSVAGREAALEHADDQIAHGIGAGLGRALPVALLVQLDQALGDLGQNFARGNATSVRPERGTPELGAIRVAGGTRIGVQRRLGLRASTVISPHDGHAVAGAAELLSKRSPRVVRCLAPQSSSAITQRGSSASSRNSIPRTGETTGPAAPGFASLGCTLGRRATRQYPPVPSTSGIAMDSQPNGTVSASTPLRISERADRLRAVFEHSRNAMLIADDNRRYRDVNDAGCRLLPAPRGWILRRRIDDFTPPELRAQAEEMWRSFLAEGIQAGEFELLLPDGSRRTVDYSATASIISGCISQSFCHLFAEASESARGLWAPCR